MKALVLSGGNGSRLRPFSHSMPKQLIPIANKPVLRHVVENIRAAGIEQIGVIVGGWAGEVGAALGDGSSLGVQITYIPQHAPVGIAHCVRIAGDFLGSDDFVMYLGDNMLPDGILAPAAEFAARRPSAQITVHKVTDPHAFGVAEIDVRGKVIGVVEKPAVPRGDLAVVGVYFFTSAINEAVSAIRPSRRGELEITDAVQWLVDRGHEIRAFTYQGYWQDIGTADDALACNRRLLETLPPAVAGRVDQGTELLGPVVIEDGASVVASRITGPVIIGAGTVVERSHVGPNTAIGENCVLSDAGISDSIVLEDAIISRVRGIHDSVIGRAARVTMATTTGHHRLLMGDNSSVQMTMAQTGAT